MLEGLSAQAWDVYALLQDQQRAGGMDVIGLDYAVLPFVFDLYDVPVGATRRRLFERIVWVNHAVNAHRAAERELEAQWPALRQKLRDAYAGKLEAKKEPVTVEVEEFATMTELRQAELLEF